MANTNTNNRANRKGKRKDKNKDKGKQGGIKIEDLKFSIGRNQIKNYEKLVKHLANKVQNKYGALMAYIMLNKAKYILKKPQMVPLHEITDQDDPAQKIMKTTEIKEQEMDYQVAQEEYSKKAQIYESNKEKLCGYLKENCTSTMITKLKTKADYDSRDLWDPVWLLEMITKRCLVQLGERHPNQLLLDAIKSLGEVKQTDKEKIRDYSNKVVSRTKSFIQAFRKALQETAGKELVLLTSLELLEVLEKGFTESLAAYTIQVRVDQEVYGNLQKSLKQQYTLGQKNYKNDVNAAMDVLNLNQEYKKPSASAQGRQQNEESARSFAQDNDTRTGFRCFKCGHKSCKGDRNCTHKNKPKSEWACMKAMELANNQSRSSFAQPTSMCARRVMDLVSGTASVIL